MSLKDAHRALTMPRKPLPNKALFSLQRSRIFFNPQRGMFGTNVVRVAANIWARNFGPENVCGWGWVCRKCDSLAQSHCHTCKILSCFVCRPPQLSPGLQKWSPSVLPSLEEVSTLPWVPWPGQKIKDSFFFSSLISELIGTPFTIDQGTHV